MEKDRILVVDNSKNIEREIQMRSVTGIIRAEESNLFVIVTQFKMHVLVTKNSNKLKHQLFLRIKELDMSSTVTEQLITAADTQ
jgi:hypothetical protein